VDQAPAAYPTEELRRWKSDVQNSVVGAVTIQKFKTRQELRAKILPMLKINRNIWKTYGPDARMQEDPAGDSASSWTRKVKETILPNNILILAILDANAGLLRSEELDVAEQLRMHVDDLSARHLHGVVEKGGARFPGQMDILIDQLGKT
jgi:hypothetical protein